MEPIGALQLQLSRVEKSKVWLQHLTTAVTVKTERPIVGTKDQAIVSSGHDTDGANDFGARTVETFRSIIMKYFMITVTKAGSSMGSSMSSQNSLVLLRSHLLLVHTWLVL